MVCSLCFLPQSVDWWSLGILMFELLTGASPFTLEGERNSQSEVSKWVLPIITMIWVSVSRVHFLIHSCSTNCSAIVWHVIVLNTVNILKLHLDFVIQNLVRGYFYFCDHFFSHLIHQTYFALRSTVPLYDWTHCSGPAEEVVSKRSPQEAGLWTTRIWRHQSTFLLQGPTHLTCQSLKYLTSPLPYRCNPLFLFFCSLTGP